MRVRRRQTWHIVAHDWQAWATSTHVGNVNNRLRQHIPTQCKPPTPIRGLTSLIIPSNRTSPAIASTRASGRQVPR